MVTVQMDGTLVYKTDAGTAIFFFGQGTHEALIKSNNVGLSDALAGKVRRYRKGGNSVIVSDKPIALWVNSGSGFDTAMVCEMDQKFYRRFWNAICADMSPADQEAFVRQVVTISKWIPSFVHVLNGG